MPTVLSIADLESHDSQGGHGARTERRFRCPICQASERALCVNMASGLWNCKRGGCQASGKLADFWEEKPKLNQRERARLELRQKCALPPINAEAEVSSVIKANPEAGSKARYLQQQIKMLRLLVGTPGGSYLLARGLSLEICEAAGVRFSPSWLGRSAVYFPVCNRAGDVVAGQGRYVDGRDDPKTRTVGDLKNGLFAVTDAWNIPALIITEAPIDALSLDEAGFPALAFCGTSAPIWLRKSTYGRQVFLAFDADNAGNEAADRLAPHLESMGAICRRLRPDGAKDWNEFLTLYGRDALTDFLASSILMNC